MHRSVVVKACGLALFVAGVVLYAVLGGADDNPMGLVGAVLAVPGLLLFFRGRQLAAKAAAARFATARGRSGSAPHVLYLRSFDADASSARKVLQAGIATDEEQLADVLAPFGSLVAIGRPGEPLPLPGALRTYASDDDWRAVVLELMRSASLVVLRAGGSKGLVWEFGQAFARVRPDRLLVLSLRTSAADYAELATLLHRQVGVVLPPIERNSALRAIFDLRDTASTLRPGFVAFADDWSARFLPVEQAKVLVGFNELVPALHDALRPVFERHGVAWSPRHRFRRPGA